MPAAIPLTIFSIPKAFSGEAAAHQRNAIRSWQELHDVQVILCGDDAGVAEAAAELGCEHYPNLRRTDLGTPRLDDAFAAAERLGRHELLAYINADIILIEGFQELLAAIDAHEFLLVGSRINLWLSDPIRFDDSAWQHELLDLAFREGTYSAPLGSDYFIYRKGTLGALPPFAVGRPYWDNWMLYEARRRGWPVIDGTAVIHAIHQNHDYGHVRQATGPMWEGPEGDQNLEAAGGYGNVYTLLDATHDLGKDGLWPIATMSSRIRRIRRRLERLLVWKLARKLRHQWFRT
jgi:hypothetical protein